MSISLPFGGQSVSYPTTGDSGWGANATLFAQLVSLYSFQKIADFSNANLALRQSIQTSTSNASTGLPLIPSGTGSATDIELYNKSNFTSSGVIFLGINSSATYLNSTVTGTGTQLPIEFQIAGTTQFTINPEGALGIGSSPSYGTSGQALISAGNAAQPAWGNIVASLTGTANEITVSSSSGAVTLAFASNIVVPTPGSGVAVTINGLSNQSAAALAVNGLTEIADDSGTLQIAGYRGVPQNITSTSRSLALNDRGKSVYCTASLTLTLPENVFSTDDVVTLVTVNSGTSVTITPGTGVTLLWANATTTGTGARTMVAVGIATIYWATPTLAIISGTGIS